MRWKTVNTEQAVQSLFSKFTSSLNFFITNTEYSIRVNGRLVDRLWTSLILVGYQY